MASYIHVRAFFPVSNEHCQVVTGTESWDFNISTRAFTNKKKYRLALIIRETFCLKIVKKFINMCKFIPAIILSLHFILF